MARIADLETDLVLSRLATKVIKMREEARDNPIKIKDGDFHCSVHWEDKILCISLARTGRPSDSE